MEQLKILVVDDEPFIRELMVEFLTIHGHETAIAGSGEEALSKICDINPDLVMLDVWMPGMTGLETLKKIKQMNNETGIIMLSAFGDDDTVVEAMRSGANYYLQKPIEFKKLMGILQKWNGPEGECP